MNADEATFEAITRGPGLYRPGEVARLLQVHPRTILNWVREGRLDAIKLSERVYRIPRAALVKMVFPERIRHVPTRPMRGLPTPGRGEHLSRAGRTKVSA